MSDPCDVVRGDAWQSLAERPRSIRRVCAIAVLSINIMYEMSTMTYRPKLGEINEHRHYRSGRPRFERSPADGKERNFGNDRKQPRSGVAGEPRRGAWAFDQGWH